MRELETSNGRRWQPAEYTIGPCTYSLFQVYRQCYVCVTNALKATPFTPILDMEFEFCTSHNTVRKSNMARRPVALASGLGLGSENEQEATISGETREVV